MSNINLNIGDKVYRPAWNSEGTPFIWEEEIISFRYASDKTTIQAYLTKSGGFSANSIGKNVYLTEMEAQAEHERINKQYPNGLPKAITSAKRY